jgi:hypothetical protein
LKNNNVSFSSLQNIATLSNSLMQMSQHKNHPLSFASPIERPIFLYAENSVLRPTHRRYLNIPVKEFEGNIRQVGETIKELDSDELNRNASANSFELDTPLVSVVIENEFSPFHSENAAKRFQKTLQVDDVNDAQLVVESTLMEQESTQPSDDVQETYGFLDPFKPQLRPLNAASSRKRWSHLLFNFDSESLEELNIKSLSIPAILPLTNDYFPSQSERTKHFMK